MTCARAASILSRATRGERSPRLRKIPQRGGASPPLLLLSLDLSENLTERLGVADAREVGVGLEQAPVGKPPRDGAAEGVERLLLLADQRIPAGHVVEIERRIGAERHGLFEAARRRGLLHVRL